MVNRNRKIENFDLASGDQKVSHKSHLLTVQELKKLRKPLRNINIEHKRSLTTLDRLAIWITDRVGTMGFFLIIFSWTLFWLGWNIVAPHKLRFDPLPAFALWLFISNMIQIFLMPLIMVGQNLQGRHAEKTKAEREVEAILMHLENQNELILKILAHLEKDKNKI